MTQKVEGNCLQLYYTGTTPKITAEWVSSRRAYRLRSYDINENVPYNIYDPSLSYDAVWDVDGTNNPDKAVIHVWEKFRRQSFESALEIYSC